MSIIDHICVLVPSLERAAEVVRDLGLPLGPRDEFPGEGTAEIYVGEDTSGARLLLVEAIGPGPYKKAIEARGPGLHHIAVDVPDAEAYCAGLAGSGWYLHTKSLLTMRKSQTVWLARPGTAVLIEVHQRPSTARPPLVAKLELPATGREPTMLAALGAPTLVASSDGEAWLTLAGWRLALTALL